MLERGDFSEEFNAIIGEFRDEQNDPIVTQIFTGVAQAEAALNQSREVAHSTVNDMLAQLNYESEQAELLGNEVVVSGIVRPADYIAGGDAARTEEIIKAQFSDFGPLLSDDKGLYFTVEQQTFVCGNFDVESYSDDDDEPLEHKIVLNLNATDDEDPSEGWLYAYPSELTVFAPVEASTLKVERDIQQKYPEIAAQLDTLPLESDDDQEILQALRDFRLTINWADYAHLDEGSQDDLLDMVETYITSRVALDTALYALRVRGTIVGFDVTGYEIERDIAEARQITGYAQALRLRQSNSSETTTEYAPALELYAPARTRHAGVTMLQVPAASIESMQTLRNDDLFDDEMGQYEQPATSQEIEPATTFVDDDGDYDNYEDEMTEYTVSVEHNDGRERSERDRQLEALDVRLTELFTKVYPFINAMYDTREQAQEQAPKLEKILRDFMELYPNDPTLVLRAEGEGVQYSNAKLDLGTEAIQLDENGSISLKFDAIGAKQGDIFESREGMLSKEVHIGVLTAEIKSSNGETYAEDERPIKYLLRAYLVLRDAQQPQTIALDNHMTGTPLHSIVQFKRFVVDIDHRISDITIPAYERSKRVDAAITRVAKEVPEHNFLAWQLHDLYLDTQDANLNGYADLSDPELLNKIGETVSGKEVEAQLTVDALGEILNGMKVELRGVMYTADGTRYDENMIRGKVMAVVSTIPEVPTEEPMLVIELQDNTWYVPITQLERFRY